MNEKIHGILFIICIALLTAILSGTVAFFIGRHDGRTNYRGADGYSAAEREVLQHFGEYTIREDARIERSRERLEEEGSLNEREAGRIGDERERLEQSENATSALVGFDNRQYELLQKLREKIGVLPDGDNNAGSDHYRRINNDTNTGEIEAD